MAEAYYERGNIFRRKSDFDKAIESYNEALQLEPNVPEVFYNRGNAYRLKGDLNNAIDDYNRAIQLKPNIAEIYTNRAMAYKNKGEVDKAIKDYEQAIVLDSKYYLPYNNLAWIFTTSPNPSFLNGEKAIVFASKACELTAWKKWNCIGTLAAAYAETGDFTQAIKYQSQVIDMGGISDHDKIKLQHNLNLYKQEMPYREILSSTRRL